MIRFILAHMASKPIPSISLLVVALAVAVLSFSVAPRIAGAQQTPPPDPCIQPLEQKAAQFTESWTVNDCLSQNRDDDRNFYSRYYSFSIDTDTAITITATSERDTYIFLMRGKSTAGELMRKNIELSEPIFKKINDAIQGMAEEKGYDFIFDSAAPSSGLVFAKEEYDITEQLLELMEKEKEEEQE